MHRVVCYLISGKMKGKRKCWKIRMKKRKKVKLMRRSRKSERTLNSCMRHGYDHEIEWDANVNILNQCAMCKGWVWQKQKQRLTTKTATLSACSRVHQVCHFIAGFHVLRVDVTLDLGFHVVIGVGRLFFQQDWFIRQHFTTHTQFQVQSSFLLDVVVRLYPVIVNSNCSHNYSLLHIAKTGFLRCCLYTLRRLQ